MPNVRLSDATYARLIRRQGLLQAREGTSQTMDDVVEDLLNETDQRERAG